MTNMTGSTVYIFTPRENNRLLDYYKIISISRPILARANMGFDFVSGQYGNVHVLICHYHILVRNTYLCNTHLFACVINEDVPNPYQCPGQIAAYFALRR